MRTCTQCHESKPVERFAKSKNGRGGLHTWCKSCKAASARAWHSAHREHRRDYDQARYRANGDTVREMARRWHRENRERSLENKRKWKLGLHRLTDADKARMHEAQGGACAICRKPLEVHSMKVDHNHQTGKIRGLLCHHCNVGAGHFFDSASLLRAAADYLEDHE